MHRLNYNQLYYFYVVASEGSVKAACEKLHLTQPTISGQLKTLEENLGFRLFDRKYRKLELNEHGQKILKRAEKIFLMGEELMASLPGTSARARRDLRIGVVSTLPNSFAHEFTLSLWKDKGNAVHLMHGDINYLISLLDNDAIDLILSDSPYFKTTKKYKSINLGNQKIVAVATPEFISLKRGFPHSLTDIPYLAFSRGGQLQEDVDYFFKLNNIRPEVIGSVDDAAFIRLVTEQGLCFSILPLKSVQDSLETGTLIRLGDIPEVTSNRWAITSMMSSRKVAVRKLINDYMVRRKARRMEGA